MNEKKKIKIVLKLAFGIIVPVLLVLAMTGTIIIVSTRTSLTALSNSLLREEALTAAGYVDQFFSSYIDKAEANAQSQQIQSIIKDVDTETQFPESDQYPNAFKSLQNITNGDSTNILGTWICDIDSGQVTKSDGFTTEPGWDPTIREWYNVTKTKKSLVTEPFIDANTKNLILSASAPVFDGTGDRVIGISGINIKLDRISEILSAKKIGKEGSLILVSESGTVVYSPFKDDIQKSITELEVSQNLIEAVNNHTEGKIVYEILENKRYGYVSNVGSTGWSIITGIPESEFFAQFNLVKSVIFIAFGIGIIIMIILILFIAKGFVRPIRALKSIAEDLAEGNLDISMDIKSNDEIGDVAGAFGKTVQRLKDYVNYIDEISQVLGQIAEGNLKFDLKYEYVGEFSKIKTALLNFQNTMIEIMNGIKDTSYNVSSSSEQVSGASQMLSERAFEQAETIDKLSTSISQISAEVNSNAENAKQASEMIDSVTETILESNKEMSEMVAAMSEIKDASGKIEKIIKTIEDIAFQTNILALNAAVEAARAGTAGKGFAVVADEVRNLASKSAEAAQDTTALIENAINAVQKGTSIADATASSLSKAVEGSADIAVVAKKINDASYSQATAIHQVTQGIEQISMAVQSNSAASQESAATSKELAGHASKLKKLINKFHI